MADFGVGVPDGGSPEIVFVDMLKSLIMGRDRKIVARPGTRATATATA